MIYGSVCSGIEAATAAWHPLGWKAAWYSEIEPFPSAVLAHHYPDVPNLGDMTKLYEQKVFNEQDIELLVGGTPCQSFSVAGLRRGLDDPRGNLMLVFLGILLRVRPRWVVWENVPGVLSSNGGRDFGTFLGALGQLGYGWAYRVLDAQYFGVAQRRRRVFVVGRLGDPRLAAAVLFERESVSGHPAPRREAGQVIAGTFAKGTYGGGAGGKVDMAVQGYFQPVTSADIAPTLRARANASHRLDADAYVGQIFCMAHGQGNAEIGNDLSPTLSRIHEAPIAFNHQSGGSQFMLSPSVECANTVQRSQQQAVAIGWSEELTAHIDLAGTMQRGGSGGRHEGVMTTAMAVRRLTPIECERLQGFPDDYTNVPYRNRPAADGPRYKALGNSMAVPVMGWIGRRIHLVDSVTSGEQQ